MIEHLSVDGLTAPVHICLDRWGIPHIRAEHTSDLFFAQGFNAARDRLWQIDLWRKRGLGLLAKDFGPGFLAQDRASRLFLYRGDMTAEWAAYGPDARSICDAFTRGINAYVDLVEREPDRLPPEFRALGTRPSRWDSEDVVRVRTHGWMRNALSEVLRANVLARANADADLLRINLEPPVMPHVAAGLDLGAIPMGVLDVYRLATAPVFFGADRLSAPIAQAGEWTSVTPIGEVVRAARPQGSNNWAVHGDRTTTGRPILASDPHRLHAVPSLRYLVHLTAPGIDVIGAVEPNFPGITIGHNGHAAFGLTLFLGPDQEDVYVYETDPAHPDAYKYQGAWEQMHLVEERFEIRGESAQTLTLSFTRHGPVIDERTVPGRAFAIRSVWSAPGTTPYGASLVGMGARTFEEFRAAMRTWGAPAVNQVYADRAGDIGWVTAGFSPVRRNWDGLLPVPGDGRYEWDGFLDPGALPAQRNPAEGFVASANAMNLPERWSHQEHPIGYEWDDPSRAQRIRELLATGDRHSVQDSCSMQNDVVSIPARRLCALLEALPHSGDLARPLAVLRGWDHRVLAESAAAMLFEIWWSRHLKPALFGRLVPDAAARTLLSPGDVERLLIVSEQPGLREGLPSGQVRDALLAQSLTAAYRDCAMLLGEDPSLWAWGRVHDVCFEHPVARSLAGLQASVDPYPLGGSESTLMKATYRPADFRVVMGASVRMVVDVGDWDRSVWINAPGQSGDPRSAHYRDLAPRWASGEYVPMLYSRGAVDATTERCLVLRSS